MSSFQGGFQGNRADRGPLTLPGPASSYTASAVHFDGSTWLINASLVAVDGAATSMSLWYKDASSPAHSPVFFVVNPAAAYINYWAFLSTQATRQVSAGDTSNNIWNSSSYTDTEGVWHSMLASFTPTHAALYVDDVLVGTPITAVGTPGTFMYNGLDLHIGDDTFGDTLIGDMADLWIFPNVSLLDGSGVIPTATRRKFIDAGGKPVNLGSDGSIPTGTAPAVFLTGGASTFGTNAGTGGAFTTTGTLTNASTHP